MMRPDSPVQPPAARCAPPSIAPSRGRSAATGRRHDVRHDTANRRRSLVAAGLAALLAAAAPDGLRSAAAQETTADDVDPIIDFEEKTPACDRNPAAVWVGRVSGTSDEDARDVDEDISFVGCFATEAECNAWRERGSGLVDGEIRENSCSRRTD